MHLTQPMKSMEETYMIPNNSNAFWDVLMVQIDRIKRLEIRIQELQAQLKQMRS